MSKNAVAIVHVPIAKVKEALDRVAESSRPKLQDPRLDVVEGGDGKIYVIEPFGDATALHLDVPLGHADPETMGTLLAVALGDLIDEHDDPRGVPMYPASYTPKAKDWAGLMDELGEALDWAPIEGPEIVDPNAPMDLFGGGGDIAAMAAQMQQMQAQLPPEVLQQAMQMAQQLAESGAMGDLQAAMQQLMGGGPSSEGGMPMDFQSMAQQAQRMLNDNPDLQQRLAGQLGITDAQLDDDDDEK